MSTQAVTCPVCAREVHATLGVVGAHDSWEHGGLCGGTGRKVALPRDSRDTALQGTWTRAGCIAYQENGRLCGAPAPILDTVRGGYVCRLHQPEVPAYLSVDEGGRLHFDVPTFIREAGLTDTPATREDVTAIAGAVLRDWWPGIPVEIR